MWSSKGKKEDRKESSSEAYSKDQEQLSKEASDRKSLAKKVSGNEDDLKGRMRGAYAGMKAGEAMIPQGKIEY